VLLERLNLPADARFWPLAARAVLDFAADCGLPQRQLHGLTWLVSGPVQAGLARAALRDALAAAFTPPRIAPLAAWLGRPLSSGMAARAELFAALRASRWVRESFGDQPTALWALAAAVSQLSDQLTWAAAGDAESFARRLQASLDRHYRRRAARAVQPQSQLVLQLWHARRAADDGAAAALRELQARSEGAAAPLVYTAPVGEVTGWEQAFLQRYAQRAPVLLVEGDVAAALAPRPLLAAAWPELAGAKAPLPIAARADAVSASAEPPLTILEAASLEEEAAVVAQQVLDWRRDGVESIALVALDRLSARRARALLERAQVLVRDETGWKLSTTSAAAAVMRWFDLVADDLYWRDLLDWLKSSFTLAGRPNKAAEADAIERAIRADGALQGARAIRGALARLAERQGRDAQTDAEQALARAAIAAGEVLALIVEQQRQAARAGPTLADHLRTLAGALDALGMRVALAADPVGRCVLREIDTLALELAGSTARASLAEFRALLAARFEEASFVDTQVDSPVMMVSLAAAALRPFDAALLIGADARHLPAAPDEVLFMSNAVRAELGLATVETELRAQAAQLASLLAGVPRVVAVWRSRLGDEPNALSPLLQRLSVVAARALGRELDRPIALAAFDVPLRQSIRPAPAAAALLPGRLSASEAQALVDCPYRFYARTLLQLSEPEDVIELPDKRDFGEALHAVLKRFHDEWGEAAFDTLDAAMLAESLRRHAETVFAPLTQRSPAMLSFARRFDGLVGGYVDWLRQHAAEGWRWTAGEVRRQRPLVLDDGREVTLHGRIDRIDADSSGAQRLIDYKARAADRLSASLRLAGEDVQLPFYGLLLEGAADSATYLGFERAREGDSGITPVAPPHPFAELMQSVGNRLRRDLRRVAAGAPLPAIGAAAVCEYCEMRGLCRRDYWEHGNGDGDGEAEMK
jgi:ATP-dependent helicase/nuclease subunit B